MVTVKDVAQHAGVSPATVSRVINMAENVSPDIRERVQSSIKELGYYPNIAARSLVKRHMGSIAVLIRNLHSPFYTELIRGMEEGSMETDRTVVFCSIGKEQEFRDKSIQFLTNGVADAIILYGSRFTDGPIIERLYASHFPFLLVENNYQTLPVNQLLIDNTGGARSAIEYLISLGHRRIAHFMGDPNKKVNLDRFNGYTETMRIHGLSIGAADITNIYSDYDLAYQAAFDLMGQTPDTRPTAILCSNDRIALRSIQGIMDAGYSVPGDISVMGFDCQTNYELPYDGPAITSVKQPLYELGRDSIRYLTDILDNKEQTPLIKTYGTELVIKGSVGEAPAQGRPVNR